MMTKFPFISLIHQVLSVKSGATMNITGWEMPQSSDNKYPLTLLGAEKLYA